MLDDLGILQKCKRFAATSGGSLIAALLALDINIPDLKSILYSSMKEKIFGECHTQSNKHVTSLAELIIGISA